MQNNLHKNSLLPKGSRILVAVSGGPDSMALLAVLHRLQVQNQWQLAVAHVNYGLRGADAEKDSKLAQRTAEQLGLPFYVLAKKLPPHTSEEKLRTIRYDFFESLAEKHSFTVVALAHHQDDQAETVLLRLIRGSGTLGLSGMQEKRGKYVRPFLSIPKSQILDFLEVENIPSRHDKSNEDLFYLRNKVRHQLLPLLETYNPKIKKVLADTADTLQQELGNFKNVSRKAFPVGSSGDKNITVSCSQWNTLSKSEQCTEIRNFFIKKMLSLPAKSLVETLNKDLSGALKGASVKEYSRLRVSRKGDTIHIHFKEHV